MLCLKENKKIISWAHHRKTFTRTSSKIMRTCITSSMTLREEDRAENLLLVGARPRRIFQFSSFANELALENVLMQFRSLRHEILFLVRSFLYNLLVYLDSQTLAACFGFDVKCGRDISDFKRFFKCRRVQGQRKFLEAFDTSVNLFCVVTKDFKNRDQR